METLRLTLQDTRQWQDLLNELPAGRRDVYYSPEYYAANAVGNIGECLCWAARDRDHLSIYPFFKRSINALNLLPLEHDYYDIEGAYGFNGMIGNCDEPEFQREVYAAFAEFCQQEKIIAEFTRFHPLLENFIPAAPHMQTIYLHDTVCIDLRPGYDSVWTESYDAKNRNMVRKAQKSGITCRVSNDWNNFRHLYEKTMDNLNASPEYYFPEAYYQILSKGFTEHGQCLLLDAVVEDKIAASLLLMLYDDYAHYHLSGRDPEYSRNGAVNLLLDFAIRQAIERGAKTMHLGGGMSNDNDDSLMRFKAGFSRSRGKFYIGKKIYDEPTYRRICHAWEEKHPDKVELYSHFLLKYRK